MQGEVGKETHDITWFDEKKEWHMYNCKLKAQVEGQRFELDMSWPHIRNDLSTFASLSWVLERHEICLEIELA